MARSTASSDGSRMRAQAERYTLAGSVACRQTTPRAASTIVVRAVGRREMVTHGDAGPALGGVDASHRGVSDRPALRYTDFQGESSAVTGASTDSSGPLQSTS